MTVTQKIQSQNHQIDAAENMNILAQILARQQSHKSNQDRFPDRLSIPPNEVPNAQNYPTTGVAANSANATDVELQV